jgi:hypothetical protein
MIFGVNMKCPDTREAEMLTLANKLYIERKKVNYLQFFWTNVAEPEEPSLNCPQEPEPELRITAPDPYYFIKDLKKFYRQVRVAEECENK